MKTTFGQQLIEASRILRSEIKEPMVSKTVDVCEGLSEVERRALAFSDKFKVKRLMQNNPQ